MNIEIFLETIRTEIAALPQFASISVVVDKQQNIQAAIDSELARARGYAVLIAETGTSNFDRLSPDPYLELKFGVTIYTPEIVSDNQQTGSQLREAVMKALHGKQFDAVPFESQDVVWENGTILEQDRKNGYCYVLYALSFSVPLLLTETIE